MSRWVTTAKPSAELTIQPPAADLATRRSIVATATEQLTEDRSGVLLPDGSAVYVFSTRFGARFAKVIEPTGFILWLQEVP